VFGLIVAIVTLMFANTFQSLYRRQRANLEEYGGRLELIYRRYCRQYPAT
jgi:biopolymer transport protein ExbB